MLLGLYQPIVFATNCIEDANDALKNPPAIQQAGKIGFASYFNCDITWLRAKRTRTVAVGMTGRSAFG
jgi:hypothetical protein